ncbi:MAG TPA: cyclase family protein [Jatrophihabitantaceae bacterium]
MIELSHPVAAGMPTYPGVSSPSLRVAVSRGDTARRLASGISFEIEEVTLHGTTGTYLDAPFHFHADRADVSTVPLERIVNVPIVVVRALDAPLVTAAHLGDPSRLWGAAVLVHTGWSRHWGTDRYFEFDNPHLAPDAVDQLVAANVALVGIDSLNVDDPTDPRRPAHHGLLGADIPIVEHLTNLQHVPDEGARLVAVPAPVQGMGSFPVRAVAVLPG